MAGLTKQQEIIIGVGGLALLGYFAFKTPDEKPLESAPGHSRPAPQLPMPKLEKVVEKKAEIYDQMQAYQAYVQQRLGEFQEKFNQYALRRTQLWRSLQLRQEVVNKEGGNLYPLPKSMTDEIDHMRQFALELERDLRGGSSSLAGLTLTGQQRDMVRALVEVLTPVSYTHLTLPTSDLV